MPFIVSGSCPQGGDKRETRLQKASATVLAMKWIAAGIDVKITDNAGRHYDLDAFRKKAGQHKHSHSF